MIQFKIFKNIKFVNIKMINMKMIKVKELYNIKKPLKDLLQKIKKILMNNLGNIKNQMINLDL